MDGGDQTLGPKGLKGMRKNEVMQMEKGQLVCEYEEMITKLESELKVLKMKNGELVCENKAARERIIKLEAEFDVAKRGNADLARENERLQHDLMEANKRESKARRELDMWTEIHMIKSEQLDVSEKVRDLQVKRIDELECDVSDYIYENHGKDCEIEVLQRRNEDLELTVVRQALLISRMRSG